MKAVLNLVLSHQPGTAVARMIRYWSDHVPAESIVIAYGGSRSEFKQIAHEAKFFVDDPRLLTRDHQRELQSYTRLFRQAAEFLNAEGAAFDFLHFAEYDHLPLVTDLNQRQIEQAENEQADLLAFHLHRVDGTNNPHYLYHVANPRFMAYWASVTMRSDPATVLSIFGSGSFWSVEAFRAVTASEEPFPIYLELYLPTLAHHLGFRVRDFAEQNRFVGVLRDETGAIEKARQQGAWTLHPVKKLWTR